MSLKRHRVADVGPESGSAPSGINPLHVSFQLNNLGFVARGMLAMTKFTTGGIAAALGLLSCTALVQAADLPLRTAPPVLTTPILVNNWDGFYAGSTFGVGFTDFHTRQAGGGSRNLNTSGLTSGALVGYNFQYGHVVFGAEGGIDLNDIQKTDKGGAGLNPTTIQSLYDIRLRGRLGYEFGWFMPFVAGGAVINETSQSQAVPVNDFGRNQQNVGYTIGAGVDFKVNPARFLPFNNSFINGFLGPLILRVEYLHDEVPASTFGYNGQSYRTRSDSNIVRAAIISRFGDNPPRADIDSMGTVNWAGAYGGVFGGGGFLTPRTKSAANASSTKFSTSGTLGGLYAGTNFMVYNRLMLGFEGSTAYSEIKGTGAEPTGRASFRNYVMADLRGRVGYAFGRVLPFAAAGILYGRSEQIDQATGSQRGHLNSEAFTIGGGIDYRISERVSLRGEYLYATAFNKKLVNLNNCMDCKQQVDGNIFRVGAAYHFE